MSKLGCHKSVTNDLKQSINWLSSFNEVKKIVLGFTENARHHYTPGTLRHRSDVPGGFKLNGYGGNGVVDIFVKIEPIDQKEIIKQKIKERFAK